MGKLSKLRKWVNRDDGRFYRAGNEPIGFWTIIGGLALVAALILRQLHVHTGLHGAWAIIAGLAGLAFMFMGDRSGDSEV